MGKVNIHEVHLADFLRFRIPKVRIVASKDCCWRCRELDGMEVTPAEALEMELLPNRLCKKGCKCRYKPIIS